MAMMHIAQFLVHGPTYHSLAMWRHPKTAAAGYDWSRPALYQHIARVCEREGDAHAVVDPCDREHPCVSGLDCVTGRCIPRRPVPACWVDEDCDKGVCRFGTCTAGVP